MVYSKSNPLSFLSCFAQDKNVYRFVSQIDELTDAGSTASKMLRYSRNDGKWTTHNLKWQATRICVLTEPELTIIAVGPKGIVVEGNVSGPQEGEIDSSDDGPKRRGDIRDMRIIGDHLYVTGMGRQVYRREGPKNWTRQDAGVVQQRGVIAVSGFNAIDGIEENEMYAGGFNGEIWRRVKGKWQQIDSPTNLVIHRVKVVRSDMIYVSGQMGLILRGHGNKWKVIDHGIVEEDLWGMEWYREHLYVACDSGIYVLLDDDTLQKVNLGFEEDIAFSDLHASDGVLLASGPKALVWTNDGVTWHDITL